MPLNVTLNTYQKIEHFDDNMADINKAIPPTTTTISDKVRLNIVEKDLERLKQELLKLSKKNTFFMNKKNKESHNFQIRNIEKEIKRYESLIKYLQEKV